MSSANLDGYLPPAQSILEAFPGQPVNERRGRQAEVAEISIIQLRNSLSRKKGFPFRETSVRLPDRIGHEIRWGAAANDALIILKGLLE